LGAGTTPRARRALGPGHAADAAAVAAPKLGAANVLTPAVTAQRKARAGLAKLGAPTPAFGTYIIVTANGNTAAEAKRKAALAANGKFMLEAIRLPRVETNVRPVVGPQTVGS